MSALGSLVVKLGLDYAQYTGGLDKSEQASLAAAKRIQDTFDGMKTRLAATAGAIAGGLAAGFTISAFTSIISGSIETGAALDDLRMQTGATVESLSALAAVGKFNNMGPEQIGAAMNKLASNLASATEEGKGTGKALEALGIDFDKFKSMRPEDQMQTVAKAMAQFEDGTGKAAVAMAFYGKQGAQMLPFLHDLAELGDLQAKVSTEQAAAAANLDDNLTRLSTSGEAWKKELANGMIPALDLGAQALLDVMNGTGGLRDEVRALVADGSIGQWTKSAVTGLTYVADAATYVMRGVKVLAESLGAYAAAGVAYFGGVGTAIAKAISGDFSGAIQSLNSGAARAGAVMSDLGDNIIQTFSADTLGSRIRARMSEIEAAGGAAKDVRKQLDFANTTDKPAKAAKEAKDPFDALRESVVKATAAYQAEAAAGEKLTEGQKKAVEVLDQLRSGKVKVTEAQAIQIGKDIEAMLAAEGENKAREEFIKSADAERAARLKTAQAMEQSAASLEEQNRAMREEIELIGLTDAAQLRVLQQRNQTIILTKEATLAELDRASAITGTMTREQIALQAEIEALRERNQLLGARYDKTVVSKAAQEAAGEWTKFTDSIYNGLSDSLYRGFEAGKGFFKSFWDGIKNTAKTTVLKFGVQGVMTGVSGYLGMGSTANAATAASSGGIAGGIQTASNLHSLWGAGSQALYGGAAGASAASLGYANIVGMAGGDAIGALATANGMWAGVATGAQTAAQSAIAANLAIEAGAAAALPAGTAAAAAGGTAAASGGVMSGIGSAVAAIPVWGWALAAVAVLGSMLSKKQTLHSGAGAIYSADQGLQEGAGIYNLNTFGMGDVREYNKEGQSLASGIAAGLGATLDGLAKTFGQKAGFEVATAFADDTSKDGAWGSLRISKDGKDLLNWDDTRTSRWAPREFADGEAGQKEYLAAIAKDTRQVLLDMDLPAWADTLLINIGEVADMDKLSAAVTQIGQTQAAFEAFGQYMPTFGDMADSAHSALVKASGGIAALTSNMATFVDRFYTDAEKLAVNTDNVRAAMSALGFDMPTTRDGFKALVQVQIALGDAGAKGLAGLLAVSGAFDAIMEAAANTTDTAGDIATRLAEQRDKALSALERSVAAENKILQSQRDSAQTVADTLGDLFDVLHDNVREIRGEVDSTRAMQAKQGNDFIGQALAIARKSGVLPDADKLAEAISAARAGLGDVADFGGDQAERNYAAQVLAGKLSGLETISEKQLSDAKKTVRALELQIDQNEQELDNWRQLLAISNGTQDAILSVEAAIQQLKLSMNPTAGKPGGANTVGGGSTPSSGTGGTARAAYGADEALTSFDKFKAWYNGIRSNADASKFMDPGYEVPDWMRLHNGADDDTDKEQFGSYLFFKNNPQYAKDFEQIYATGRSSMSTDGSSLVKTDLTKLPKDIADYYRSNTAALLGTEGFGLDPVLAYQLYNFGPGQFGLDGKKQSFTEWLQNTKWTENGLVSNNNVVSLAQMGYSNYNLARWETSTGNIIDTDGTVYSKDGKRLGVASQAQLDAAFGPGYKPNAAASANSGRDDYLSAIKANTDDLINKGWSAQQLADALASTGTSLSDIAAAYNISVDQVRENLINGGATNIPGFAGGGNHFGGLRVVGERGWELEATGPSRIWNQQQLAQVLGGGGGSSALESLVRELIREVSYLKTPTAQIAVNTSTSASVLASVKRGDSLAMAAEPVF